MVPNHNGRRGHPVLFPWLLAAAVGQLREDQGVNALLERGPVVEVPFDLPRAADIDTPDEYVQAKRASVDG